jgi:hypothetical protein
MKRYTIRADSGVSSTGANIFESSTGYWVSYIDHEAAIKPLREALQQIADPNAFLHSGSGSLLARRYEDIAQAALDQAKGKV